MKNKELIGKPLVAYMRLMKADGHALSDVWHTERTCKELLRSKLRMETKYRDVRPHGELCNTCKRIAQKRSL